MEYTSTKKKTIGTHLIFKIYKKKYYFYRNHDVFPYGKIICVTSPNDKE